MTTLSETHLLTIVGTTAAVLIVGTLAWSGSSNKKDDKIPPLVQDLGLWGFLREINQGRFSEFLIDQFQKVGHIYKLPFPFMTAAVICNPPDARAIYQEDSHWKPPAIYRALDSFSSGPSIVSISGGDSWFHRRKALNKAFAPKIVKQMNAVALEQADVFVQELVTSPTFDVGNEMILLTIRVICKAALDYDVSSKECHELLHAIRLGTEEFTTKTAFNPLRKIGTFILSDRQEAFVQVKKLREFAIKLIGGYRQNASPTPDTALDVIMKNTHYKDDAERISDIIMILFGGHDTTGYTMAFALLALAKHPLEQQQLREALRKDASTPYLQAVIQETMRLYTVLPVSAIKQLSKELTTKDGYILPKGSIVVIAQGAIARDPILFPNPSSFDPSRWLEATYEMKQALFPFSLGKRNCLGQPLANAELRSVLPRLVQEFEFEVAQEGNIFTSALLRVDNCLLKATKVT